MSFIYNYYFQCFTLEEIHEKDFGKYSIMILGFDKFKIVTLNWVRISKFLMENLLFNVSFFRLKYHFSPLF